MTMETAKIDLNVAVQQMSYITLAQVSVPISVDIKRVILEGYPGAEQDLCLYLVKGFYDKILTQNKGALDTAGRERAFIFAKWQAARHLTTEMNGLVERSTMFLLLDAQTTGWHHYMEYEDVAELLADILEQKEGSDEAYDWKFIVETLVPAAQQANIPVDTMINASLKVKKLRSIVAASRELLARQEKNQITPDEAKATLTDWLTKTADSTITFAHLHEEVEQWRGNSVKRDDPVEAYKMLTPEGNFMLVIPTKSDKEMAMIEQALRNRADFKLTGFDWLTGKVLGMMKVNRFDIERGKEARKHGDE